MIGRNYHIQDYLRILCKFIYVSNGKFLNWVCLSILILGVFRTKQERLGEEGEGWYPEEKITMADAIRYYTLGAAYAQFMENRKGMIKTGYLADIVIIDKDLFNIPENEIMRTKVDYTITGGKVVYSSGKR